MYVKVGCLGDWGVVALLQVPFFSGGKPQELFEHVLKNMKTGYTGKLDKNMKLLHKFALTFLLSYLNKIMSLLRMVMNHGHGFHGFGGLLTSGEDKKGPIPPLAR